MFYRTPSTVLKKLANVESNLRNNKSTTYLCYRAPQSIGADANYVVQRAQGTDLEQISPLGALQLIIERINQEARNEPIFRNSVAIGLFSKGGRNSKMEIEALWEKSPERKAVYEIYSLINLSKEVGRPITFRDAFNRVYASKVKGDRTVMDNIARALIINR